MAKPIELDGTLTQGGKGGHDKTSRHSTATFDVNELTGGLGRFRLEGKLGHGAMGVVYAAFDPDLERRVALKVLRQANGGTLATESRERFLREARAMARVNHPNVVTVHEVGTAQGLDYIAMELVEGGTMAEWLTTKPPQHEVLAALLAAGQGLAAAHAQGLVHRDFKPHNVLRSRSGQILVTDFGLARAQHTPVLAAELIAIEAMAQTLAPGAAAATQPSQQVHLTHTGAVIGTPAYMAPEQWEGTAVGPATDQFALAVAVWEGLTHTRPFVGDTLDQLRQCIMSEKRTMSHKALNAAQRKVLQRALAHAPAQRFSSVTEFLRALDKASRPWLARHVPVAARYVAAVLALAAGAAWLMTRQAPPAPQLIAMVCGAPGLTRAQALWTPSRSILWQAHGRSHAGEALQGFVSSWSDVRTVVCKSATAASDPRLACLAGTMARAELYAGALEQLPAGVLQMDFASVLLTPLVCNQVEPPRLAAAWSGPAVQYASEALRAEVREAAPGKRELANLAPDADSCSELLRLHVAYDAAEEKAKQASLHESAKALYDRCGDEFLRLQWARAEIQEAQGAEYAIMQLLERYAGRLEKLADESLRLRWARYEASMQQPRARIEQYTALSKRAQAAHLPFLAHEFYEHSFAAALAVSIQALQHQATVLPRLVAEAKRLDMRDGQGRPYWAETEAQLTWLTQGPAAIEANSIKTDRGSLEVSKQRLAGVVYLPNGQPAADAEVVVTFGIMLSDAYQLATWPWNMASWRTRTDAQGQYQFAAVPAKGVVAAQQVQGAEGGGLPVPVLRNLGEPFDHVATRDVVLKPLHRFEATVAERGMVAHLDKDDRVGVQFIAPIDADGRIRFDNVPLGTYRAFVGRHFADRGESIPVEVRPGMASLRLALRKGRALLATVRGSTVAKPGFAQVIVLRQGATTMANAKTAQDIMAVGAKHQVIAGVGWPSHKGKFPSLAERWREGDVIVSFEDLPLEPVWLCALGVFGDLRDPQFAQRLNDHIRELPIVCKLNTPDTNEVVLEVPPHPNWAE